MKKFFPLLVVVGVLFIGGGVFFLTQHFSGSFLSSKTKAEQADAVTCDKLGADHQVTIKNDTLAPAHVTAEACDTLTITNADNKVRDMAFGVHDHHVEYDGISVKTLAKDQSFTVTLNKKGTYLFHDHHQDEVAGDFKVE
jgi:plastocyanin